MKTIIAFFAILFLTTSCGVFDSLNSNTSIKPKESFIIGNNKPHLKNEGVTILKVYQAPINGGTHSPILIKPQETAFLKTEKDTALIIENTGDEYASVTLKVKGDLNLGMTYNN
jgi:hypothetical protein